MPVGRRQAQVDVERFLTSKRPSPLQIGLPYAYGLRQYDQQYSTGFQLKRCARQVTILPELIRLDDRTANLAAFENLSGLYDAGD